MNWNEIISLSLSQEMKKLLKNWKYWKKPRKKLDKAFIGREIFPRLRSDNISPDFNDYDN